MLCNKKQSLIRHYRCCGLQLSPTDVAVEPVCQAGKAELSVYGRGTWSGLLWAEPLSELGVVRGRSFRLQLSVIVLLRLGVVALGLAGQLPAILFLLIILAA